MQFLVKYAGIYLEEVYRILIDQEEGNKHTTILIGIVLRIFINDEAGNLRKNGIFYRNSNNISNDRFTYVLSGKYLDGMHKKVDSTQLYNKL